MNVNIPYVLLLDNISYIGYNKTMEEKIEFFCTAEGLETIQECLPKPSKAYIPEWFKNIPANVDATVRKCPSFPDYFSQGYIIPMWQDVIVRYTQGIDQWGVRAYEIGDQPVTNAFSIHGNEQMINYVSPWLNGVKANFVFKFNSPWRIITPPGWSVLQLPLFYHFNDKFSVLPGVIDSDIAHEINMQVLYHTDDEEVFIERGTPMAMYIPFKRENKLDLEVRYQTPEDERKMKIIKTKMNTKFPFSGVYRQWQRERDKHV